MFLQFGGYITGYLLLWFWGVIMGVVIGGAVAVLSAKSSTGLGAARGAVVGAGCALLALLLVWLSSPDNGAVTPPSWAQALLAWAEITVLLGVLPGVMAGLGGRKDE
jgi:hypothetical protein